MSDELMNTPQAEQETEVFGIEASTDGRRNSYTLSCGAIGQSMNYAACLWRQGVLAGDGIKTPADWAACDAAGKAGNCKAMQMREEELIAGRSIYFRSREAVLNATRPRQWIMPVFGSRKTAAPVSAPKPAPAPTPKPAPHLLDAVGTTPTYADAIERIARADAAPARIEATKPAEPAPQPLSSAAAGIAPPVMVALPGESPLAMARRLRAAQQSTT